MTRETRILKEMRRIRLFALFADTPLFALSLFALYWFNSLYGESWLTGYAILCFTTSGARLLLALADGPCWQWGEMRLIDKAIKDAKNNPS